MAYDMAAINDLTVSAKCLTFYEAQNDISPEERRTVEKQMRSKFPYYVDYSTLTGTAQYEEVSRIVNEYFRSLEEGTLHPGKCRFIGVAERSQALCDSLSCDVGNGRVCNDASLRDILRPGELVVPVEYAIVTGQHCVRGITEIRDAGGSVEHVLVFFDRREMPLLETGYMKQGDSSAKNYIEKELGVRVHTLTDVHSLIPFAARMGVDKSILLSAAAFYDSYGADRAYSYRWSRQDILSRGDAVLRLLGESRGTLAYDLIEAGVLTKADVVGSLEKYRHFEREC